MEDLKMNKVHRHFIFPILLLGLLAGLLVGSGINTQITTDTTLQNLEGGQTSLHTNVANLDYQWHSTWIDNGYGNGWDVAVDTNGSVYCVGYGFSFYLALVKFAPNGTLLWGTTWDNAYYGFGKGVAVDTAGFVYCTGGNALVKVAPNGTRLWNSTWSVGTANGLALDYNGSLYVYCTRGSIGLIKFDSAGNPLWDVTWDGAYATRHGGVAVDATGFVYCAGNTANYNAEDADFVLIKFAPNGTRLWNTTWGGIAADNAYGVAVDADNFVYCVGYTRSYGTGDADLALVKFAPNGTWLWTTTWGGADGDAGCEVLYTNGSLYCVGSTEQIAPMGEDLAVVKVHPDGTTAGHTIWDTSADEFARGAAVDVNGALYCVGTIAPSNDPRQLLLIKFATSPSSSPIPGFNVYHLLIGLLALIAIAPLRKIPRKPS
jgi:hypothetical protein